MKKGKIWSRRPWFISLNCLFCSALDILYCKCGACSIDGGNEYTRVGGDFKLIHWVYEDGCEEELIKNNAD